MQSSNESKFICGIGCTIEKSMNPDTNGQVVGRFTWTQGDPDNRENPITELRGNRKAKYNSNPLVPPGHGIYPIRKPRHLVSAGIHFNRAETTRP